MNGQRISLIYFYLISTISIVLLVIGIYHLVTFAINAISYDKYPLRYAGGEDCEYLYGKYPRGVDVVTVAPNGSTTPGGTVIPSPSPEEMEREKKACQKRIEAERKQNFIEDIRNAVVFTLMGTVLFALHFPLALKKAKDK